MLRIVILIVILVIVLVVIFVLLREFNCWYWKINERISLLNEQNTLLKKLVSAGDNRAKVETTALKDKRFENKSENRNNFTAPKMTEQSDISGVTAEITDKLSASKQGEDNNYIAPQVEEHIDKPGLTSEILDKLSAAKRYKLERLIEDMEKTDIIVFHDNSVKLLNKERWDGIVSSGAGDKYEILYRQQQQD
jgi:hypothetical protein